MGAIINIFKNIIGLITGLFSKKGGSAAPTAAQPQSAKAGKRDKDGFLIAEPSSAAAPVAMPSVAATVDAPTDASSAKATKSSKKGKGGKAAATAVAAAAVAAAPMVPKVVDPVDLINAALAASAKTPEQQQAAQEASAGFAEMNAVPMSSGSRRRPGANMAGFMDMAKTVKSGGGRASMRG